MYALAYSSVAGASLTRTRFQSASISSAAIMASAVCDPCPISQCGTRTVTRLSGVTRSQVVSCPVVGASSATTLCLLGENATPATPRTKPPPASVPVPMNARRVHLRMFASSTLSDRVDRTSHPYERATAADVRNRRVDVFVGRTRKLFEQRGDRHDHARLAVPTLRH